MKKLFHILSVLFLMMPLWQSCDFGQLSTDLEDAVENIELRVALPNFESFALFRLVDATTNQAIYGDCQIEFLDQGNLYLYDILGNQNQTYSASYGVFQLGVNPTLLPSTDNPLEFIVKVSAAGYESMTQRISMSNEGLNNFIIKLVDTNNLPDGIDKYQASTFVDVDNTGTITNTPFVANISNESRLTIPAGTTIRDINGNPITNLSAIRSQVRFYDPESQAALESYPGGLDVLVENTSGQEVQGGFTSGGLFKINMQTQSGQEIKSFSNGGVEMDIEISPSLINPKTGQPIKAGDEIDLWSLNEETGKWKQEGTAHIYVGSNGKLRAKGTATHLSYWNFDYFYDDYCGQYTTIQFSNVSTPFSAELNLSKPGYSKTVYDNISQGYNYITVYNFPSNTQAELIVSDDVMLSNYTFDFAQNCGQTYTVDVSYTSTEEPSISVTMDLDIKCEEDSSVVIKPNWLLFLEEVTVDTDITYFASYASLLNGKVQMDLVPNTDYEAYIYYEGDRYEVKLIVTGEPGNYIMNISGNFEIGGYNETEFLALPLSKNADGSYLFNYTFYPEAEDCEFINDL